MSDSLVMWIEAAFAPVGFGYKRITRSAYSLKHDFEHSPNGHYVTEAEFQAAMLAAGHLPQVGDGYFDVAWYDPGMERPRYIYTLSDPRNGMVCYVGQTWNLQARQKQHVHTHVDAVIQPGTWTAWLWDLRKAGLQPTITAVEILTLPDGALDTRFARLQTFMIAVNAAEECWIRSYQTQGAILLNKKLVVKLLPSKRKRAARGEV